MTEWRTVGNISVCSEWVFTTFLFGEFVRLTHNSDDDGALIAYFDFPSRSQLLFPRRIYASQYREVLEIPRFPFSQACLGIKGYINVPTWIVKVEVGKLPPGQTGYPSGSNFSSGGTGGNGNEDLIPGNVVL